MPPQPLASRVDKLEERVTVLEQLPARIDRLGEQILQLRDEMRSEFSAIRGDLPAGERVTLASLREEIRVGDEETRRLLREEIRAGDEKTRRVLREEIRAGDENTRRLLHEENERVLAQDRMLHEEVIARLKLISEGRASRRKR